MITDSPDVKAVAPSEMFKLPEYKPLEYKAPK